MSFQDDHKITNADRVDKGVVGLPDTPGLSTIEMQERFDSLANLTIEKYNGLVDAVEEEVTDEAKLVTGAAVKAYTDNKVASAINDYTPSTDTTYSSEKINNQIDSKIDDTSSSSDTTYSSEKIDELINKVADDIIDDNTPSSDSTYSSEKIDQLISDIPVQNLIDDNVISLNKTYSSSKIEDKFANVPITPIDDSSVSQSSVFSSSKVNSLINGIPSPGSIINDSEASSGSVYSSSKVESLIGAIPSSETIIGVLDPPNNIGVNLNYYVKFNTVSPPYKYVITNSSQHAIVKTYLNEELISTDDLAPQTYTTSNPKIYDAFKISCSGFYWNVLITSGAVEEYPIGQTLTWHINSSADYTFTLADPQVLGLYIKVNGVWYPIVDNTITP